MAISCSPFVAMLAVLATASLAGAQGFDPPARPFRGLFGAAPADPNRTTHELTLVTNFTTGFEDALNAGGSGGGLGTVQANSTVGQADGILRYWIGKRTQFIEVQGRGIVTSYPALDLGLMSGGSGSVQGATSLGRRVSLNAGTSVTYQPLLSLGTFGTVTADIGGVTLPDVNEALGLHEQRSLTYDATTALSYSMSARQTLALNAFYSDREYLDGDGYSHASAVASLGYTWNASRAIGLSLAYRYNAASLGGDDPGDVPQTDQSGEVGLAYTRRVGPTRTIRLEGGIGSSYVETIDPPTGARINYWTPAGHAQVRMDIGRSWAAWADYRRSLNVLDAVSRDAFFTDGMLARVGGYLGRRMDLAFTAGLTTGQTRGGLGDIGRYDSYSGSIRGRYALLRNLALLVSYDYYKYELRNVVVTSGFPTAAERNTIRAGLSLWLPLYGTYGTPTNLGGGR